MKKVTILSLPGGGVKGTLQATVLAHLERLLQQHDKHAKLVHYFDLVSGTSIGGVLCCLYNTGKYSAEEISDLLAANARNIFKSNLWERAKDGFSLWNERYSAVPFYKLLEQYLGDLKLSDCLKPSLITAYDMEGVDAYFFKSHRAKADPERDFYLRDVALSTAAAPTKFQPVQVGGKVFIDGGLHVNNSAMCAWVEAGKLRLNGVNKYDCPETRNMILFSLGTGGVKRPYLYSKYKNAGILTWLPAVLNIAMGGNNDTVRHQLTQIFEDYPEQLIQPILSIESASTSYTDASRDNIRALQLAGQKFIEGNRAEMERWAGVLVDNK